jgi:hypothetical protein
MIPERCHSCLPDSLEIVHENRSCFLGLFTVLLGECFNSFFNLFDLRLVLDLWQVKGFDVVEEMLHFCGLWLNVRTFVGEGGLLEIYDDAFTSSVG